MMKTTTTTEHLLEVRWLEGTWSPARGGYPEEYLKPAVHLAWEGNLIAAIWEAEKAESEHHRAVCDRGDHSECRHREFSVRTTSETRTTL